MKYFSAEGDPALFRCPCGNCDVGPTAMLLDALDLARDLANVPFKINSGPRCRAYCETKGFSLTSEHIDGEGADVHCPDSATRNRILRGALEAGFNRVGIGETFVHLGVSDTHTQDVVWTYY